MGPGTRLGRYELKDELGAGGMAVVYRAEDTALRRQVAVKVLYPHLMRKPEFAARFFREARAAAQLDHPHILRVFDVGGDSSVPDEPGYIVMELVKGTSLKQYLDAQGPPFAETVAMIGATLAEALAVAHGAGVIHRDVKPANVMLAEGGRLVLCDFGVARVLDDEAIVTQTGALLGTPAYMSPEQALGKAVDARSDLYSLGATLYELATGVLPVSGTAAAVIATVLKGDIQPADRRNPRIGKDLARVVGRLMALKADDRYPDAEAARAALSELHQAAGFGDRDGELARYFADPGPWNAEALPKILSSTIERARAAAGRRELARALGLADRVLAFQPDHPEALAIAASAGKEGMSRTALWALAGGTVACAAVAVAALAAWRPSRPLPAPPPPPAPVVVASAPPDAGPAIDAALPVPDAPPHRADAASRRPPEQVVVVDAAVVAVVTPPDAAPAPPPANAVLVIDIKPYCKGTFAGRPFQTQPVQRLEVPPGTYVLDCTGARHVHETITLAPGEKKSFTRALLEPVTVGTAVDVRVVATGKVYPSGSRFTLEPGTHRIDVLEGDRPQGSLNITRSCTIKVDPELGCY